MGEAAQTALAVTRDSRLAEYGEREKLRELSSRIKMLLPGGNQLSDSDALALAQYAVTTGANPFRGEVYGYRDWAGKLQLVEGYKLLVRWAKQQCNYYEKYTPMPAEDIPPGGIGIRCWILREDSLGTLKSLIDAGFPHVEAYEIAASHADGVVTKGDMYSEKKRKDIDPPKGWTWEQVARKRALKNALNLSHGAPSIATIARESWVVDGVETIAEDWDGAEDLQSDDERERLASMRALERKRNAERAGMTPEERDAEFKKNVKLLRGEAEIADWDDPGAGLEPRVSSVDIAASAAVILASIEGVDDCNIPGSTKYKVQQLVSMTNLDARPPFDTAEKIEDVVKKAMTKVMKENAADDTDNN